MTAVNVSSDWVFFSCESSEIHPIETQSFSTQIQQHHDRLSGRLKQKFQTLSTSSWKSTEFHVVYEQHQRFFWVDSISSTNLAI